MVRGLDIWSQPVAAHGGGRRNEDPTTTNKTVGRCSDGDWDEGKDMVRRTTSSYAPQLNVPCMASTGPISQWPIDALQKSATSTLAPFTRTGSHDREQSSIHVVKPRRTEQVDPSQTQGCR